jgi:pimeloyl-ACP methyl ester carboxylesterase
VSDLAEATTQALREWPAEWTIRDVATRFGSTCVYTTGPDSGRPILLLPGGGATAASWYATAGPLADAGMKVYAVDIICDKGRSVPGENPVAARADLVVWLRETMQGLGLAKADLAGHSYGGWIAAHHAIHAPDNVDRLLLLDASTVFAGFQPRYLLRSLPLLVGDHDKNMRRLLAWETRGRAHGLWAELMCSVNSRPTPKLVLPKRPTDEELKRLPGRTLVLVAGRARAHNAVKIAATARRLLPEAVVEVLPEATHHTIPAQDAGAVNEALLSFLHTP